MGNKKIINYTGSFIIVVSVSLAAYWFDWRLAIVIYLALLGFYLDRYNGQEK